jgi:hypothetical protein
MVHGGRGSWVAAVFATLGVATACNDAQSPKPGADLLSTGGAFTAAVTTTGSDNDPDGYSVWVDNSQSQSVGANGLAAFTGLAEGAHEVGLLGVATNCTVQDYNPRAVLVTAGVAGATRFDVGCDSKGSLFVSTSTTGVDLDADGYTVTVDGSSSQPVATNGNVTFTGVATGSHAVALSGVAGNCSVSGASSGTVTVSAGGSAPLSFSLNCTPTGDGTGTLTVTTSTTGANVDPDGYTLTLDGSLSQAIASNGSVTVTVPAGDHPVALSDVAANCTVSEANPRTVTVPAAGAATTTFAVTCSAQPPPPEATGHVQLGMGSAAPGNNVETFTFDVRADLTGRFTVTDYSNLYPDGTPASMTTDPAADPATSITAYRNSSSACSDPTRGVEFDAVGRVVNDGAVVSYTVQLCDNGPAGSGGDFLSIFIPVKGYGRSGSVTSGDVVKR